MKQKLGIAQVIMENPEKKNVKKFFENFSKNIDGGGF